MQSEWSKERGIPEDPLGYELPEDLNFQLGEDMEANLRTWALENQIGNEGFQQLLSVYNSALPNFEAEKEALGQNADDRVERVNNWLSKNVSEDHHDIIKGVMTTAKGVEFMEQMAGLISETNFAPETGEARTMSLSKNEIREMQADPRYQTSDVYREKVRKAWQDYARRNPE